MNLTVGLGLALALMLVLGGAYLLIRKHGKQAAEGEQAKEGLKVSKRVQDVDQPLPGDLEKRLKDGTF